MIRALRYSFILVFSLLNVCVFSQGKKMDTLELARKLKEASNDSVRLSVLNNLARANRNNQDVGIAYANRMLKLDPLANRDVYSMAYLHLATIYKTKGKHKEAEEYCNNGIEFARKHGLKSLEAMAYGTLGNVYTQMGDLKNSSTYLERSVSLFVELKDTDNTMLSSMNLGGFYYNQNMYDKALVYFKRVLNYALDRNDEYMMMQGYNNIGGVCLNTGLLDSAFNCYTRTLALSKNGHGEIGNIALGNMGDTRKKQKRYEEALKYYFEQYDWAKKEEYYQGMANALSGLMEVYQIQGKFDLAIKYMLELRDFASENEGYSDMMDAYGIGSDLYESVGKFKEAFYSRSRYMDLKDSIEGVEVQKQVFELHEQYQSERKDNEILKKTADLEKEQANAKQRSTERNVLLIIVAFAVVMIFFVARGYFQKKKYNEEITAQKNMAEKQKELVEEKNKEILDSINYAKRIQEAILPSNEIGTDVIKESFVLYKPKDIVAGDFYWYSVKGSKRIITAADCTGHGVPGALMSMLGITFLNEIVNHAGKTKPSDILSELRDLVKETLKQRGSEGESKDGMDMALICYDTDTLKLEFCGANNPLWIFRTENGKTEFIEIDPDKRPVGYFRGLGIPFTNKEFQLKKGDRIYLFTDGFADQFGGPKGKKFKYKQLQELITSGLEKPMSEQHKALSEAFENWRGVLEQVDDVCIIGLRV